MKRIHFNESHFQAAQNILERKDFFFQAWVRIVSLF